MVGRGEVVHPLFESVAKIPKPLNMIGIDPRHSLHHLSLLPPGPDEVRDRLLRGDRSKWFTRL